MGLEEIKKNRKRLDITQKELAKLAGVSQSLIAKIERGRVDPAYSKVIQITEALEAEMNREKHLKVASDIMEKHVISAKPNDRLGDVLKVMKEKSISQLPVVDKGMNVGSVVDDDFVAWFERYGEKVHVTRVSEVMTEAFPIVPESTKTETIAELLRTSKALLVGKRGETIGIITKADLMKLMKKS